MFCRALFQCWDSQLGEGVLFPIGIALGFTPGVGQPCTVWQQGTTKLLKCAQREDSDCSREQQEGVCRLVPLCLPCREDMLVLWRWGLHFLRVTAAALLHLCVWEPRKGPCPWGSQICPILLLERHILSADLSGVLHGSVGTLQELGLSYIEYRACGKSVVLQLCSEKIPSRNEGTLPMQPAPQRIGPRLNEFHLRLGCSGAHPLLWLKQISQIWLKSLPSQHQAIRGTIHFVLSVPFFSITFQKMTVQVNSCPGSSAIQKKEAFLLHVVTAQWQFNFLFTLCPYRCGIDPDNLKWLTVLPRKGIFYLGKGKRNILMLFLQRIRKEWWQNFLLLGIFVFDFYLCLSA